MKKFLSLLILISFSVAQAAEKDLYDFLWLDPDKSVYVLQKKIHRKKNKAYFQAGYLSGISSDFQDSSGYNLDAGYYFHEEFGIELSFSDYTNSTNATYENVKRVNNAEPFIRRSNKMVGIMAIWSPFYGKINTFNKIYYFDVSFGLGFSALNAESNLNYVGDTNAYDRFDQEGYNALLTKVDFKLHINERIYIQTQLINQTYKAAEPQTNGNRQITNSYDFTLGLGYNF